MQYCSKTPSDSLIVKQLWKTTSEWGCLLVSDSNVVLGQRNNSWKKILSSFCKLTNLILNCSHLQNVLKICSNFSNILDTFSFFSNLWVNYWHFLNAIDICCNFSNAASSEIICKIKKMVKVLRIKNKKI